MKMIESETIDRTITPIYAPKYLKRLGEIVGYEMTRDFIQQFLELAPKQLAALRQLFDTGDVDRLCSKAHQFKSECLQLGAIRLGNLCEQVENLAKQGKYEVIPEKLAKIETELILFEAALKSGGQL